MPPQIQPQRLMGFSLAAFFLLIFTVIGGLLLARNQYQANRMVVHTLTVERKLVEALERMRALEAAQRGYLIGREAQLAEFDRARREAQATVAEIHALTIDNPSQTRNADALRTTLERRLAISTLTLELKQAGQVSAALALAADGPGPDYTSAFARRVSEMMQVEQRLFDARSSQARRLSWWLTGGQIFAMLLMILMALMVTTAHRRRAVQLARALEGREEAEGRLRHLQKMESIGQLTGGIAHDFNNMLAIIIGSLDVAEIRLTRDPDRARKCIGDARIGAELAAKLTARLLAFSRQQPLSPKTVDANILVGQMHELLARTLGERIDVETILSEGLWCCFIDPSQLESAVLNLAVNARDAMPDGGQLVIETGNVVLDADYVTHRQEVVPGDYVMISVSDSGCGMPPEVIERAFDPFFTTKEVGKGTGLGLSQVYGFIKQSGGHVALYSEIGKGSAVKLYLPRRDAVTVRAGRLAAPAHQQPPARPGEVVLVVEDEERLRSFSTEALADLGYEVLSAGDGHGALEIIARRTDVTLLFTDVVMPGMNGRELAERAARQIPGLRVLYTTGYTRNAVVHNGILDEGVAMLAKPFTLAQLASEVRAVIDGAT